jgi:hypothetical protein
MFLTLAGRFAPRAIPAPNDGTRNATAPDVGQ